MNQIELAEFVGLLMSEGGITGNSRIFFTNKNLKLIEKFKSLAFKLFGVSTFDVRSCKRALHLRFSSAKVADFLRKLSPTFRTRPCNHHPICPGLKGNPSMCPCSDGTRCNSQFPPARVPEFIKSGPEEIKISFLRALFSGDGSCTFVPENGVRKVKLTCFHPIIRKEVNTNSYLS